MNNKKDFLPPLVISIIILALAIGGWYLIYENKKAETSIADTVPQQTSTQTSSTDKIPDLKLTTPVFKSISKAEYEKYANLAATEDPEYQACKSEDNANNFWRCEEVYRIEKYPGIVRLNETCLEITIKDGSKKRICDNIADDPSVIMYTFSDYIPGIGYFIKIGYWEGSAGLLINEKTGEEIKIYYEKPVLSPSGNQFLSTSAGGEAGYVPDGFQVWQKSGDSYILKIKRTNRDTNDPGVIGISNPVLADENSFYFMKSSLVEAPGGGYEYIKEYGAYSF